MKTLYLIRHAKASWEHTDLTDFERPLTETGQHDAVTMGQELKGLKVKPDYILCSDAVRAIHTAQIIAEQLAFPLDRMVADNAIYSGGVEELVTRLKAIDAKFNTVICVGHNPNLTWLCHYLCESAKMNLPTCGVVGIEFNMKQWSQLTSAEGQVTLFIHPQHEHD